MSRYGTMPKIDLNALREQLKPTDLTDIAAVDKYLEQFSIVRRIVAQQGPNKGRLRASKPKVQNDVDPLSGKAAYVWRMVSFMCSPNPKHSCMPVTADWDLPVSDAYSGETIDLTSKYNERREMANELDALVDKVVATLPVSAGALSWARGFGIIG